MVSIGQVKIGSTILFRDEPYQVVSADHIKMGRGQAKLSTKLKNLLTQAIIDQTFQGNDRIDLAQVSYRPAQFLYADDSTGHFMVNDTFEQLSHPLPKSQLQLLKEGTEITLLVWNDRVIGVNLPTKVDLEVSYTEPGFKGDTSSDPRKSATVETGATVQVPLFIKTGDKIRVKTETSQYDSRV